MNLAASKALFSAEAANLPRLAAIRSWVVHKVEFPEFDIEFVADGRDPLRVRIDASDWNEQPPSVQLLDSKGTRLKCGEAPRQSIFHQGPHQKTGHPFICMVGSKEYHTHSSHLNDLWDNHRQQGGLLSLLTQIWSGWLHAS